MERDVVGTNELLLWIDDLPRNFRGDNLDNVEAVLKKLGERPYKGLFVVATAPDDQLDKRYRAWLKDNDFIRYYSAAIGFRPFSGYFNSRGTLHADEGRPAEALADYDEAIRLDPDYAWAFYNRGRVLRQFERFEEAVVDLEAAAGLGVDTLYLHMHLAGCYRRLERAGEAARHLALARERLSEDDTIYNRACLEALAGNDDLALQLLEQALDAGKVGRDWVCVDADWYWLRHDPRFRRLVGDCQS